MDLRLGDCLEVLPTLPDCSVDAVVTDPPYGLGFMGKRWDSLGEGPRFQQWCREWASECLRVLKPGGHMIAFGGTRTWHRLACGIEDAGFEIRDSIAWIYSTGFPKSMDVGKAIDKAAGAERPVTGKRTNWGASTAANGKQAYGDYRGDWETTEPATDPAREWAGWGTAMKPAHEPVVVARKPLVGTVVQNVLAYGTGALHVDGALVGKGGQKHPCLGGDQCHCESSGVTYHKIKHPPVNERPGRWPANVALDVDQAKTLDAQSRPVVASRFYYIAKAPRYERPVVNGVTHPTVKPVTLIRWLVRLVTPPEGTVLDPFLGTGTTAEATLLEGFPFIGIEADPEQVPLIESRLARRATQGR